MEFNQENSSTLFHYCNELADALRGVLNIQQYNSVDQIFWEQKLNELKRIINNILDEEKTEIRNITDDFIREAHLRIFSNVLSSTVMEEPYLEDILNANEITKLALKELYGIKL